MFNRRKQKRSKAAPPITFEDLEALPYAVNFDLPREEAKLKSVYEHDRSGGNFDIRKVFASKGVTSKTIATVDHFPDYFDLVNMVEQQFGGGTYNVHPAGRPRVFKTYIIDGPPVYKVDRPQREKSPLQKLKDDLEEAALLKLQELVEQDPVVGRAFAAAWYKKHSGVELPPEPTWEEQLVQEAIKGNSEYQEGLIRPRLRERGVEFPEEKVGIERLIAEAEQTRRLRDALGAGRKGIAGLAQELIPAIPVLLQAFRDIKGGATAGPPIGPALDTPADATVAPKPVKQPVEPIAAPAHIKPIAPYRAQPEIKSAETAQTPPHLLPDIQPEDSGTSVPHLDRVDWVELEIGAHSEPEQFIQGIHRSGYEEYSLYHRQLAKLFQDNEPDAIRTELSRLAELLVMESGEDYEFAVLVLKHLEESEEGRLWLAYAHAAAESIQGSIDQVAHSRDDSTENRNTNNYGFDEEDFDGPMLI